MTFDQAISAMNRQQRFMATVHAMNTLLLLKKVYSSSEFEQCFIEWATKEQSRKGRRPMGATTPKRRTPPTGAR